MATSGLSDKPNLYYERATCPRRTDRVLHIRTGAMPDGASVRGPGSTCYGTTHIARKEWWQRPRASRWTSEGDWRRSGSPGRRPRVRSIGLGADDSAHRNRRCRCSLWIAVLRKATPVTVSLPPVRQQAHHVYIQHPI